MKIIWAIANKEFNGYFKNYTAYIVLSVYLLLSMGATFYSAYFFDYNNCSLISFFIYQPEILNILVPALTMKMWADERRHGTLEFLLTQPVKHTSMVLGKFLASVEFGIILLLTTVPFILYSSFLVKLDVLNLISSFLALIFTMISLCALGCLISSLNNNTIIAYLSSLFCGWLWQNINFDFVLYPLQNIFPLIQHRLYGFLNFHYHYQAQLQGQLGADNLIYFLVTIFFALWLNTIIINHRKL